MHNICFCTCQRVELSEALVLLFTPSTAKDRLRAGCNYAAHQERDFNFMTIPFPQIRSPIAHPTLFLPFYIFSVVPVQ